MDTFSIELSAERIYEERSREYFREILSSYMNGNYRSAVVMLWTVIVCDLIYKLQSLQSVYNDKTAKDILEIVQQKQEENLKNPEWEKVLLDEVHKRTELIDNAEYEQLEYLQKQRHLSAHPVLKSDELLYVPNQETTRALIRNALEAVLLKPPILSRKIVRELVQDIANKKHLFLGDDDALKRYLVDRYLKNLRPTVANLLFRDMWKFVFHLSNSNADENRQINYQALRIIYFRRPNELKEYINREPDHFSNIGENEASLTYLIDFLNSDPSVYEAFRDSARAMLQQFANENIDIFTTAIFLSGDVASHLHRLRELVNSKSKFTNYAPYKPPSEKSWQELWKFAKEANCETVALGIAIEIHVKSGNFDFADWSFVVFIEPYLELFDQKKLHRLLEGINDNSQVHARRKAIDDCKEIHKVCEQTIGTDFNYAEVYPNYYSQIEMPF